MASSRIEIAASPYGCVLRDHNQRIIRDRERNREGTQAVFRKNLEVFVRDHLQTCIVFSTPREDSQVASSNENFQPNSRFGNSRNCRERSNSGSQNFRLAERERNQSSNNNQGEKETEITAPDESHTIRRQSRILDRWGTAHQARETMNTTERQTNEAEIMALSSSQSVSARASSFLRENSPTTSDSSVEQLPTLRASSLVQRWREIEAAESKTPRENQSGRFSLNSNPEVIRSCSSSTGSSSSTKNSRASNAEDSSYVEDPSSRSEVRENGTQTCEPIAIPGESARSQVPEDLFPDWASDRTASSEPHSSLYQRQSSDVGETERGRVADIIKRLSTFSQPNSPVASSSLCDELDRENSSDLSDHGEQRSSSVIGNTLPRVRGRQALKDLLIQVEQERQKELGGLVERQVVSRFTQRGRLQALLRLKILQRGAGTQNQERTISRASELDQLQRRPTIFHLRERFNSRVEQKSVATTSEEDTSRSPAQLIKNVHESEHFVVSRHDGNHNDQKDVSTTTPPSPPLPPPPPPPPRPFAPAPMKMAKTASTPVKTTTVREQIGLKEHLLSAQSINGLLQERVSQSSKVTSKRPRSDGIGQLNWQGALNTAKSLHCSERNGIKEKQPDLETCPRVISSIIESWEEGTTSRVSQLDLARPDETVESSNVSDGGVITEDEPDIENVHHEGFMDSWQEISVTEEESDSSTHQLVEPDNRTWLRGISHQQSDFEDRRQAWYRNMLESNTDNDEIRELFERRSVSTFLTSDLRTRMDQMISSFVRQIHQTTSEANEHEYGVEEETLLNHEHNEISDYSDQIVSTSLQLPLPSRVRSRSEYQDNDVSDGDQYVSTSFHEAQSSHSYEEDSPQSSPFTGHRSLEMELIYDLRGHMAQLSQEMSELRKSIKSCMGMQEQLQHSIKKEVSSSVDHSGEPMEFNRQRKRKGNCCICYEMPVDSLLYRCGHMCTCFKCAHELQWSSGRCPICRASILDVVRAYSESQ
ncbi:hypothetical protein MKW94_005074 [Papaver nudicaule]|uniref:RING-type domain-containing protein n=1 Tax=Papaver nudicaule TaxID=74823 RepID=A0AA42B4J4_PAPNU|nr:hypothetical protein [Papaver nudicaule]